MRIETDIFELAVQIEETIEKLNVKRLLLDGSGKLQRMMPQSNQFPEFMDGIINTLKNKNITAIYTNETPNLTGVVQLTDAGLSAGMDTVILLRYVEIKSEMRKAISVLKIRGSNHDKEIREVIINNKGVEIKLPFTEYSGILSGNPTKTPSEAFLEAFKK